MSGKRIAGHQREMRPLSPVPSPRCSPDLGWQVVCQCGWQEGPFTRRADGEKAYSRHLLVASPICQGCKEPKAERFMSKASPHKCKACAKSDLKAWREANPSRWERSAWKSHLKRKYGITPERYEEILASQGGLCAICFRKPDDPRGFRPHLDHDHETGHVRGILCRPCNKGLGMFADQLAVLRSAVEYLEKHSKEVRLEGVIN